MKNKTFIKNKVGFTLIEIIVALFIVGIMAAISIPKFLTRKPQNIGILVSNLNNITFSALSDALRTGKMQKVTLDFRNNKIFSEGGESAEIPNVFEFVELTIAGNKEQLKGTAYFYVNSEGIAQEVEAKVINIKTNTSFSLILNPFLARFKVIKS